MCGVVGTLSRQAESGESLEQRVGAMADTLVHRGPDDRGVWASTCGRMALGHRRLAIVDLSPRGHQPMVSRTGRYVIAFNGEIYNHRELRDELEPLGSEFRGHSDTEVLLAGFEQWGVAPTLRRAVGMFAIGLWDCERRELKLARDRFGEKPLHVRSTPQGLAFASELQALTVAHSGRRLVNPRVLELYLAYGYVPEPLSILSGCHKVAAGTIETWSLQADRLVGSTERFWQLEPETLDAAGDTEALVDLLHERLTAAIADQMLADVPVGCLLSGGVDSTVVTAIMQSMSRQPVRTFTVSFDDRTYDEGPFARDIATHLGTHHEEIKVSRRELLSIVDEVPAIYDEPFANPAQIPMVAVARAARQHVTVALSGDGGDELFGGYNRYYWPQKVIRRTRYLPGPLRRWSGRRLAALSGVFPDYLVNFAQRAALGASPVQDFRGKLRKAGNVMASRGLTAAYLSMVRRPEFVGTIASCPTDPVAERFVELMSRGEPFEAMTQWDLEQYLPGDSLAKVDRASMSTSLEIRAPLLDHRIAGLARASISTFGYPSFSAMPKWPLRKLAYRLVPPALIDRPKMGFSVPMADWLRTDLRGWMQSASEADKIEASLPRQSGAALRRLCAEHLRGRADYSGAIWAALVYLKWAERNGAELGEVD